MPEISVIIPTYNHEEFIEQTLESVFEQTFTDYEIIVVNDGSPDETSKRLKPYLKKRKIRYYEKEKNEGQAAARNLGLSKAKGTFIAFLDDDDLWPPDKLRWQRDCLKSFELTAVGGPCGFIEDGRKIRPQKNEEEKRFKYADFFHGNPFVSPGQVLIRADALHHIGGFDESLWGTDDLDLWMHLSKTGEILMKPKLSLWYRRHSVNASKDRIRMLENSKKVIDKNSQLPDKQKSRQLTCYGYRWIYRYAGRELVVEAKNSIKKLYFKQFFQAMFYFTKTFFPQIFKDRTLTKKITKDWIPNRIRDRFDLW